MPGSDTTNHFLWNFIMRWFLRPFKMLEVISNFILKFIYNIPFLYHTSSLYNNLNILKLNFLNFKNKYPFMYNVKNDIAAIVT